MKFHGGTVNVGLKLLIIRDASKKNAIDGNLPPEWRVIAVGDRIDPSSMGPFDVMVCACELYTDKDWQWYGALVKYLLKDKTKLPIWTN